MSDRLDTPLGTDKSHVLVGLYGLPGCGKTTLLNQLKNRLSEKDFLLFEGSEEVGRAAGGGLEAFKRLSPLAQERIREAAIGKIQSACKASGKAGVVTGHFMIRERKARNKPEKVMTEADLSTYTHIIYLKTSPAHIAERRNNDKIRSRPVISAHQLETWQDAEIGTLRQLCEANDILFVCLTESDALVTRVTNLIRDFQNHNPAHNTSAAKSKMDTILKPRPNLERVLLLDGDRTLIPEDTGYIFWQLADIDGGPVPGRGIHTLKALFSGRMGYSYRAFRQATLCYEELESDFLRLCTYTADNIALYPEFVQLLREAAKTHNVATVVVTSGVRKIWEMILDKAGLSATVKVVGGGRIEDGYVVNDVVKGELVDHIRATYNAEVIAFGDSPLDLPMLQKADKAVVVVGEKETRSKTMTNPLVAAITAGSFRGEVRQALLPPSAPPRFNTYQLPVIDLKDPSEIDFLLGRGENNCSFTLHHATNRASAKLLASPTRDANVSGPHLRNAHSSIGAYLATEFVSDIIGLEEYDIPHVQGHTTTGHRLRYESQTLIVPILRGGEPMAFGVAEVFPAAMFVHAKEATDLKAHHVQGHKNVILVDSVVNSGKTVVEFMDRLRELGCKAEHVVFVTGVAQSGAVDEKNGPLVQIKKGGVGKLSVVALRVSDNKFKGVKSTDTGNRLFNTTHLD